MKFCAHQLVQEATYATVNSTDPKPFLKRYSDLKSLRFDLKDLHVTRRFEIWGKNWIWDLAKWFKSIYRV